MKLPSDERALLRIRQKAWDRILELPQGAKWNFAYWHLAKVIDRASRKLAALSEPRMMGESRG